MRCSVVLRCVLLETARFFFARREKCRRKPSHHRVRVAHPSGFSILALWRDLCLAVRHIAVRRTVLDTQEKRVWASRQHNSKQRQRRESGNRSREPERRPARSRVGRGEQARALTSYACGRARVGRAREGSAARASREHNSSSERWTQFVQGGGEGRGMALRDLKGEKPVTSRNPIFCPGPEKSS